ncbi:MAG: FliM/FliN family flagellar motor switch protein [Wigglesworthia glossinidia]|nr:FliM/FliN family flagellar motor switch protein [Wigglesworthia glossinidia]
MSDQKININKNKNNFLNFNENFSLNINKSDKKNQKKIEIIQKIHQKFSGHFKNALINYLNKPVDVLFNATTTQKYNKFIKSINNQLISINVIFSDALKTNIFFFLNSILVSTILEIFFGGPGNNKFLKKNKKFTISENRTIQNLVILMMQSYKKSWDINNHFIDMKLINSDTCIQTIEFDNEEDVLVSSFKLIFNDIQNDFFIIFSESSLEIPNVFYKKSRSQILKNEQIEWKRQLSNEIKSSELNIQVKFSEISISISNLINLKKGKIIPISCSEKLTAYVDCVPVFSGYYGSLNGHYALKVDNTISSSINELKKKEVSHNE